MLAPHPAGAVPGPAHQQSATPLLLFRQSSHLPLLSPGQVSHTSTSGQWLTGVYMLPVVSKPFDCSAENNAEYSYFSFVLSLSDGLRW